MAKKSITITPYDTPWEVACMIINAEYKHENIFNQEVISPFFNKDDLRAKWHGQIHKSAQFQP